MVPGIFRRGQTSDEGAKMWFSGYYKCQKSMKKNRFSPSDGGLACWRHPWEGSTPPSTPMASLMHLHIQDDCHLRFGEAHDSEATMTCGRDRPLWSPLISTKRSLKKESLLEINAFGRWQSSERTTVAYIPSFKANID